ncbi:MAG: hypothetical protein OXI91_06515 [Chloroflexota bacterium]|nr:hypothetical protein [Chloroflexota bacterium]
MQFLRPDNRRSPLTPTESPLPVAHESCERALELVNYHRMMQDEPFLAMGANPAAQLHADNCLKNGHVSQWDLEGLKPYMRHSLQGGCHPSATFAWQGGDPDPSGITDLESRIESGIGQLFNVVGHRPALLDPLHRKANIGIAWNRRQAILVLEFQGDYVEFDALPRISGGNIRFSGSVKNRVRLREEDDLGVQIWYDPLPGPLTTGQLLRVNAYDHGVIVAALRRPLPAGQFWQEDSGLLEVSRCTGPEEIPPDAPVPSNQAELDALVREAWYRNEVVWREQAPFQWITCGNWNVGPEGFAVEADISPVLQAKGPGVYTLALWAPMDGRDGPVEVARYSMFVT